MTQLIRKRKFAFDLRVFAILMILAIGPLSAANWWLLRSHQNIDLETSGMNLAEAAEMGLTSVNSYLQQQIRVVAGLTQVPVLRDAIHRGNRDLGRDLEQIRKRIPEFESRWRQLDLKSTELRAILDNPASDFLRRFNAVNKSYHEILITDSLGRLVATTGKTTQYYLANEYWWKETYGDGRSGSVYVGDAGYDKSAESYSLEMAEPFFEGDGVIGVVRVVLDVHEIDSVIGSIYGGSPSSRAALIQAKGSVVSAPGYTTLSPKTFPDTLDILKAREWKAVLYWFGGTQSDLRVTPSKLQGPISTLELDSGSFGAGPRGYWTAHTAAASSHHRDGWDHVGDCTGYSGALAP